MVRWLGIIIGCLLLYACQSGSAGGNYQKTYLEKRIEYLTEKAKKSLVNITMIKEYYLWGKKKRFSSLCSGSIISEDGLIITNYHCCGDAKRILVTLWNHKKIPAEVVGEDPLTDLALIKLNQDKLRKLKIKLEPMKFGNYEDVREGDYVLALGSPFGFSRTATLGIVANKKRVLQLEFEAGYDVGQAENPATIWIHHTAPIYGGNSGGPLINMNGEQIGVNARGATGGLSLAISIHIVKNVIDRFLKFGGKPKWAYYGWRLTDLSDELKEFYKLDEEFEGVFISDVVEGSPAQVAGVSSEDILLEVDGKKVNASTKEEVPFVLIELSNKPLGNPVSIKIRKKDGNVVETKIIPEEWELWETPLMAQEPGMQREKDFHVSEVYGISAQKITKRVAVKEKLQEPWGVFVTGMETGSIAANAGLQGGDIIKYIDDKPITDMDTFKKIITELEKTRPEKIKVTVQRGNSMRYLFFKDIEKSVSIKK